MQFTRFLRNPSVTTAEMVSYSSQRTAERVIGRDVVVLQDTSEVALGGRRAKACGYGPIGKGGALRGILLHAAVVADAGSGAVLGLVDAHVWNRTGGSKVARRRLRKTSDKESQRWIESTKRAGEALAGARQITMISDRESDIYEHFAYRPNHVHLIVRACQNRKIEAEDADDADRVTYLFAHVDGLPEQARFEVEIPAAPGRKARLAELAIRYSEVVLREPLHGSTPGLPATIALTMVDVRETSPLEDGKPLHWRLLTTHSVTGVDEARRIVELYRMRWAIEEFFHTLKTAGFDIEAADIGDPRVMMKFTVAAAIAAVTVMQLVKARDGTTDQSLADAFEPTDQPLLEAVSTRLEGPTAKQQNPHPKGSLAFAAWVIARLGGWTGYYGKPGPLVMRRGLDDFQRIKLGASLRLQDV